MTRVPSDHTALPRPGPQVYIAQQGDEGGTVVRAGLVVGEAADPGGRLGAVEAHDLVESPHPVPSPRAELGV
jgi:hypothetical protein